MICAVGMPDEMRSTARPRRAWGIGIVAVASASRPPTIAGTKRSLTMTKPEMMPRTAPAAPHTERFAGGGGGASASLALLSGAARASSGSTFASDAPTHAPSTHTADSASNLGSPAINPLVPALPRRRGCGRNGVIRPIAVPTAKAALMGSRTQLPTASAGLPPEPLAALGSCAVDARRR